MNKNICLLVMASILALASASSSDIQVNRRTRHYLFLEWWMNQLDLFLTTLTVGYCFQIGWYNVYNYNDGGIALYNCLSSFVEPINYA